MISQSELQAALDLATAAAVEAGGILDSAFRDRTSYRVDYKEEGINNVVTEMDRKAEALLRERLSSGNGYAFLGEESGGSESTDRPTWVVDPIDGTVNYAHGIPIWSVSIALVQNNRPLIGVIRNPNLDETFTAMKGSGAQCNGRDMSVSSIASLSRSLLVTGFPYDVNTNPHGTIDTFAHVVGKGLAVRRLGSAALDLAYVADGRFEAFWESTLHPWDVAAGLLMVMEAGGMNGSYAQDGINDTDEIVTDRLLSTNGFLHPELRTLLQERASWADAG